MKAFAITLVLALVLVACSAGAPTASPSTDSSTPDTTASESTEPSTTTSLATTTTTGSSGFPVTVSGPLGNVEITARPERIVSLSPSATETLFAIGAGDQVVATDSFSYFPAEAPTQADLSAFEPNVESIVATYEPDLVIISWDPGNVVESFAVLDIPTLVQPAAASFEDAYAQWEQLGVATGNLAEAVALINATQDTINEAVASVDVPQVTTYYHELDPGLYSVTSTTFLGTLYARFGLENVADAADADGFGYPQLSAEYLVDVAPEIIFFTTCCGDDSDTIASRAGWGTIPAVMNGNIFGLDFDVASRWGPRIGDLAKAVAEALTAAVPSA